MKYLLILLSVFSIPLFAQQEIDVTTKVNEVTVYRQGSLIVRKATSNLPAGDLVLKFQNLMAEIDLNSVKFSAEGDITVLNIRKGIVSDTIEVLGPKILPDHSKIQTQISQLEIQKTREQKLLQVYTKEESFLQENLSLKTEKEAVNLDDLMRATEFARTRYLDIRKVQAEIEDRMSAIDLEIANLRLLMNESRSYRTRQYAEVEVRIHSKKAHQANLELSYFYQGAGWYPSYEARVTSTAKDLELINYAKVYQRTDEEWSNIKLVITNGQPQLNQTRPQLAPKYLQASTQVQPQSGSLGYSYNSHLKTAAWNSSIRTVHGRVLDEYGEALPFVNILVQGTSTGSTSDFEGKFSISIPQNQRYLQFSYVGTESQVFVIGSPYMEVIMPSSSQLLESVVIQSSDMSKSTISLSSIAGISDGSIPRAGRQDKKEEVEFQEVKVVYNPTQVRYELNGKHSIPNDGEQYDIAIQELELPSDYQYEAVPSIDPSAYLTARISGWEQYNLLSGPLNIYFDKNYVGKAQLNLQYMEDTLSLSLGRDPGIKITRKTLNDSYAKKFIASKRHLERAYEFEVRNNKREAVKLVLYDQIPVSYNEDVKVILASGSQSLLEESTGILTWDIDLNPGDEKTVKFQYEITYPPSIQLNAGL